MRNIHCVVELAGDLPAVNCNQVQIQQVLTNLLANARDALNEVANKTIRVRSYCSDQLLHIEIEDSGSGMPESAQASAFLPFFTTKPVGEGTGLGLSISYGILKEHKGILEIKHTGKAGTCMAARLPLCA